MEIYQGLFPSEITPPAAMWLAVSESPAQHIRGRWPPGTPPAHGDHTPVQGPANITISSGGLLPQRDVKTDCQSTSSSAPLCTQIRSLFCFLFSRHDSGKGAAGGLTDTLCPSRPALGYHCSCHTPASAHLNTSLQVTFISFLLVRVLF